jgi:hypothetical protein
MNGLDTEFDCTAYVTEIKAKSLSFVGRYYRMPPPASLKTPLTASEAKALTQSGLSIVSLFEYLSGANGAIDTLNYNTGVGQGQVAYEQAVGAKQPANTPIYFAVDNDYDITNAAYANPIDDYFRGVSDGYKKAAGTGGAIYQVGVYGSGLVCGWVLQNKRATYAWLAESVDWSGYRSFTDWNIKQSSGDLSMILDPNYEPGDDPSFDFDQMNPNCGAWTFPQVGA